MIFASFDYFFFFKSPFPVVRCWNVSGHEILINNYFLTLLGLLATVPSNPNGNGENSTSMMGIPTTDATQDTAASSGIFYNIRRISQMSNRSYNQCFPLSLIIII